MVGSTEGGAERALTWSIRAQFVRPCWLMRVTAPRPVGPAPTTTIPICGCAAMREPVEPPHKVDRRLGSHAILLVLFIELLLCEQCLIKSISPIHHVWRSFVIRGLHRSTEVVLVYWQLYWIARNGLTELINCSYSPEEESISG